MQQAQQQSIASQTSGKAIASLVLGILCIPVIGIIFGHLALGDIRRSAGALTGRGMAIAGLVLGYLQILTLVLVTVVGMVATLAIGNLDGLFGEAKAQMAENWVNGTGKAYVEVYNMKHGTYPSSLNDLLVAKDGQTSIVTKEKDITDPWGNLYQYQYPGRHNPDGFDLWTISPDGETIGNWDDH